MAAERVASMQINHLQRLVSNSGDQAAHLAAASQLAHSRGRVAERTGHPAQHHLPIASAAAEGGPLE